MHFDTEIEDDQSAARPTQEDLVALAALIREAVPSYAYERTANGEGAWMWSTYRGFWRLSLRAATGLKLRDAIGDSPLVQMPATHTGWLVTHAALKALGAIGGE